MCLSSLHVNSQAGMNCGRANELWSTESACDLFLQRFSTKLDTDYPFRELSKKEKKILQNPWLKGDRGGSRSKSQILFVKTYVVALVIVFLKWAHFPLNSKRLPRYDPSKMGHFSAFSDISIGKSPNLGPNFNPLALFLATGLSKGPHLWFYWKIWGISTKQQGGFWKKWFLAFF